MSDLYHNQPLITPGVNMTTNVTEQEVKNAIDFTKEVQKLAKWIAENTENDQEYKLMLIGAINGIKMTDAVLTKRSVTYSRNIEDLLTLITSEV